MLFINSTLPVNAIDHDNFNHVIAEAELIVADRIGPKVMKLKNGNIIKLFRRKRWLSTAMVTPYAVRFINNAFSLKKLGIQTIRPVNLFHCSENKTHLVEYEPLPGNLLRQRLQQATDNSLFEQTAKFIAELHHKGIYFRSLHFENIVLNDNGLGLIDVADMKIYNSPLPQRLRERNFQHFMRYPQDAKLFQAFGENQFQKLYSEQGN